MNVQAEPTAPMVGTPAGGSPQSGNADLSAARAALIGSKTFKREATFERAAINAEARTCDLSFSSENPVERMDWMDGKTYREILSHDPSDMDLTRLNDAHPLLLGHDPERQIGVVESAAIGADKKGRATVRFSKSQLADEIWNDVKDGIRRLVSVGYRRVREVSSEIVDGVESIRFAWQPYEISLVSVPADATVGVGRAAIQTTEPKPISKTMSEQTTTATPAQPAQPDYREVTKEIFAIAKRLEGKVTNAATLAQEAVSAGKTVEQFRSEILEKLPVQTVQKPMLADVKPRDWANYSIGRACAMLIEGVRDGFEKEISDEISLRSKQRPQGLWLPDEVLNPNFGRSLVQGTGTLGGMVVSTPNLGSEFVELLRNRAQVINLGARVLNLDSPVTIPRQNAAGATNVVGETVASTLSVGNFTQFTLTPQAVSANQQYSKQLLMVSNPSIDALVRDDIVQQIALHVDLLALHGSGSSQPRGIVNTTGIGTVLLATNGQALSNATAYPALVSLESVVATANADAGSLAYLMRPGHRGALKTSARFANSDTPVWDVRNGGMPVNGYRAEVSAQLATNLTEGTATTICTVIIFGNWNDVIIGNFGATDLVIDPYTAGANGVVRLYARKWIDVGVRHPASFAVLGGILTT